MDGENRTRLLLALDLNAAADLQVVMVGLQAGNAYGLEIAGIGRDCTTLLDQAKEMEADAVLLSPNLPGYHPEVIQRLLHNPERPIVTVAAVPAAGDWAVTMEQAGAVAHLTTPLSDQSLAKLASTVPGAVRDALVFRTSDSYVPRVSEEVARIIDTGGWQKQMIGFWSPSGGMGKTTLAVNTAACLGVIANKRTLLVDADMNKGDAHLLLDMTRGEEKNIYALGKHYEMHGTLNAGTVQGFAAPYGASNLWVVKGIMQTYMAAERCLADESKVPDFMMRLFSVIQPAYDFIVWDLGQTYNHPVHLSVLTQANLIFLVVNSTITSLNAAHKALGALETAKLLGSDRLRVVVNRFHPKHRISRKHVQDALKGQPIFAEIAAGQDEEVVIALNEGDPIVLSNPGCEVARDILGLASTLYPALVDIKKLGGGDKRGFLSGLLGG
jgi:Flp pilus assembly CpaE family ATPase